MRTMRRIETIFKALGTANRISVQVGESQAEDAKKALADIRNYVCDMDDRLSAFKPTSLVRRIGNAAGKEAVPVDKDTYRLLQLSERYRRMTKGAFDITIGEKSRQWREERDVCGADQPDENALEGKKPKRQAGSRRSAGARTSRKELCLKESRMKGHGSGRVAYLRTPGLQLDLGGVAKGYALDHAVKVLRDAGIEEAEINFGGSIASIGWGQEVGIQDPFHPFKFSTQHNAFATVFCQNEILITSGIYEQQFRAANGDMSHHILDPKTGRSAKSELASVTLIGRDGALQDALATACIILGVEKSLELCRKHGLEAVFVLTNGRVWITEGLRGRYYRLRKEASA